MFYITVEFYSGETFKYLTATEHDANFFKTLADNCSYAIKQLNIINLYEKENANNE